MLNKAGSNIAKLYGKIGQTFILCLKERRPYLATECSDLPKAEKWRRQVNLFVIYNTSLQLIFASKNKLFILIL